jgi:hypothetical protein
MFHNISETDFHLSLDLDQTLIATQDHMKSLFDLEILSDPELLSLRNRTYIITMEDIDTPGAGITQKCWGITRPGAKKFLTFCCHYFKSVSVFSAGKREYVEPICDFLFRDLPYPTIVFSRDEVEYNKIGDPVKPLIKLMKEVGPEMTLKNTLHLDDLDSTYERNPDNGILIPAYNPQLDINSLLEDKDDALMQLQNWLLRPEVINCNDVRLLDKDYIFKEE